MPTGVGPQRILSIDAAATDETLGKPFDATNYPYVTFWITGTGTTSSGVVTIEETDWDDEATDSVPDTPFWSSIQTVNASDVTGGARKAIHLTVSKYRYVRPRISTAIGGGGTITVVITASGAS